MAIRIDSNQGSGNGIGTLLSEAPSPRAKLLLVDDRPENLVALSAVLEPLGEEIVLARSGTEALKHLLVSDFAVILLDVQMPEMDGFETATFIKQREKSRNIPIIFVTAINTDERYISQGYQTGAVDYLAKPIDPVVLRSKVTVFIALHKQAEQIRLQGEELRLAALREAERKREAAERERERRYLTELAQREAELRQFKATLDVTHDAVFLFDSETYRFFYVNRGAVSLLGYAPDELIGQTPFDLATEGSKEEIRRFLPSLPSNDATSHVHIYESQYRQKSGNVIPVEVMTQFVAPQEGGSARFVSIVRDISERKRSEAELATLYERERKIAEALQQSIVLAPPEDLFPGLTIATLYQAAWGEANIGGDYLDVFALEKGKVALIVGDVSGKGLSAAARTAEVKYALRAFLREDPNPSRALSRLNTLLCETRRLDSDEFREVIGIGNFICIAVAVISPQSGEVIFGTAGCEPPLIVHVSEEKTESVVAGGPPIGIDTDVTYESSSVRLENGDFLLLVTDGITEARRGRDFYGYEGFTETAFEAARSGNVHHVGKAIMEAARRFAEGKLHDDTCLLIAQRHSI